LPAGKKSILPKVFLHFADKAWRGVFRPSPGDRTMPVNAITQATGADLLNLYSQSVGQGATEPSVAALKTAIAEAQLSEESVLGSGGGQTGTQINVYG
jgi:hypothetical protein